MVRPVRASMDSRTNSVLSLACGETLHNRGATSRPTSERVVYKAEKQACQVFPDPHADDLKAGANRNFQVRSPLDFLAPRLPKTGHATHSAKGMAFQPLLRLVLQPVARQAYEGGSIRRAVESGRRAGCDACAL